MANSDEPSGTGAPRLARSPVARFVTALLLLSVVAGWLLWRPGATVADERAWRFYGTRQAWLAAFDAVSAVCGAGLLHGDFEHGYSAAGRWVLTAAGFCGALAVLLTAAAILRRLIDGDGGARRAPGTSTILAAFVGWQVATIALAVAVERLSGSETAVQDIGHRAVAAFSSLGWWAAAAPDAGELWLYVAIAVAGGLGWPLWLLSFVRGARFPAGRMALGLLAAYAALTISSAALIAALEMPRSQVRAGGERVTTGHGAAIARFDRALAQGLLASSAGIPVDGWIDEANDGSRFVLACLITVGALPGSAGGGIRMAAFLLVIVGVWRMRATQRASPASPANGGSAQNLRLAHLAGVHYSAVVWLLLIGALGLLIIQNLSASPYQTAHTFADALLDSASAVAGGGLTSGISAALLDPSLSSGMHSPVDRYQYGAAWLMLLMLAGRIVPLWLLARFARRGPVELPAPVV